MANTSRSKQDRSGGNTGPPGRAAASEKREPPYPAALPPPVYVPPPTSRIGPARARIYDREEDAGAHLDELREELITAREQQSPEGLSTSRQSWLASLLIVTLFGVFMVLAISFALARYFGWAALLVGLLLVALYVVIGGGSEWLAARMRVREERQIEDEVTIRLKDFERPPRDESE